MPLSKMRHISPHVAELYSNRSDKTLQRDLDALIKMNLVRRTSDDLYSANITLMLAFLPITRVVEEPEERSTPRKGRGK